MSKINAFLADRFSGKAKAISKMKELAERSNEGALSGFSGLFRIVPLSEQDRNRLEEILFSHKEESQEIVTDLEKLSSITCEVKAINSQAALLHGERIEKARDLLKKYRDGAFSAWLVAAYGNRQTPYNFLQYFELYRKLSDVLQKKLSEMPKQAVYVLASRDVEFRKKEKIIEAYQGESKKSLLSVIRKEFPLPLEDKRREKKEEQLYLLLQKAEGVLKESRSSFSKSQKEEIRQFLQRMIELI